MARCSNGWFPILSDTFLNALVGELDSLVCDAVFEAERKLTEEAKR